MNAWVVLFAVVVVLLLLWAMRREFRSGDAVYQKVYEWEHGLRYRDGKFDGLVPPGRYLRLFNAGRVDIFTLRRGEQTDATHLVDVTSKDKLVFRLSAYVTYEIVEPRTAYENNHVDKLRLAAVNALVALASRHTLDEFIADRAAVNANLAALIGPRIEGCDIKAAMVNNLTLPPEVRRLFVEIERAKLEAQAALERARGEHAALRSLANAAQMLKGNPELMNLRLLQAMSGSGKSQLTLVTNPGLTGTAADPAAGVAKP